MSRRSQHRRRILQKDYGKWSAYMPKAVERAQREQLGVILKKKVRA